MRSIAIIFLILFFFIPIQAEYFYSDTRLLSLAGAQGAPLEPEAGSLFYNPAILNNISNPVLNIDYLRFYNFADLYKTSLSFVFPYSKLNATLGVAYENQDFNDFNQNNMIFSSSCKIKKVYTGINLKRYNFYYPSLENNYSYGIDAGIIYPLQNISFYYIGRNFGREEINISTFINSTLGLSIYPVKSTRITLDYYSIEDKKSEFIISQESKMLSWLSFCYGIQSYSHRYGLGANIKLPFGSLNYGLLTHPTFEPTHSFSMGYKFK